MNERDEQILANLPAILDGILAEHRANNPNQLAGLDIPAEGGPYDGQVFHNDTWWHGDWWEPEVDGVRHRYALGTRWTGGLQGPSVNLWFHQGIVGADGRAVLP